MTQFGGANTITAPEQDGFALGSLQSFQLGNDGTIMGVYSNGLRQPLGKLALASFNNPGGLEKAGSSSFRVGDQLRHRQGRSGRRRAAGACSTPARWRCRTSTSPRSSPA